MQAESMKKIPLLYTFKIVVKLFLKTNNGGRGVNKDSVGGGGGGGVKVLNLAEILFYPPRILFPPPP